MSTIFFSESSKNIGGQELQLLQQATGLKAKGYLPRVLCRPHSRIGQEAEKLGLPVDRVSFRNAIHLPGIIALARLIRKHKPAALVCHSGHDSNLCSIIVHCLHRLGLLSPRPMLIRMRTYQPGPAKAFVYNHMLKEQLLSTGGILPSKISVLYPGIDFEAIQHAAQAPLAPDLEALFSNARRGPVIVHAAMFRPEKGHCFMLQLVKQLLPRFPDLSYIAAGEGQTRALIQTEASHLGIARHVIFPGTLNPVAPLIGRADVVVMPSSYEPLGMSQIEALGLGVPVVVSHAGGLPETVIHAVTGHVCPAPDAPDALHKWVQVLEHVLTHPAQAREQAQAGKQVVLGQFGKHANIEGLVRQLEGTPWPVSDTTKLNR